MADGTKLKPYIVFNWKTLPKGFKVPPGVIVHCQAKGWMNEELCLDWLTTVWEHRPGAALSKKSMLVLDAF